MIYFFQAGITGPIKVGYTADPDKRLRDLQVGCPDPIYVRALLPGDKKEERRWHDKLAEGRHRGEWFKQEPTLRALAGIGALWPVQSFDVEKKWPGSMDSCPDCNELTWPWNIGDVGDGVLGDYCCINDHQWSCWGSEDMMKGTLQFS